MLTLAEMESTLQIEYELRLEGLGEVAMRELLADAAALNKLVPGHLSEAEGRRIAEATLAELIARKTSEVPPPPSDPTSVWEKAFTLIWMPFRGP